MSISKPTSNSLFRKKPIEADPQRDTGLKRSLGVWDLTLLGIGAIIGAGIFVLTGIAAATQAGPAIILSYIVAGIACAFSALSYAELAGAIGGCGSAYGYSYAAFGELIAWLIGWDLILEYSITVPAVAVGWSGYFDRALYTVGLQLPHAITHGPFEGGIINLPAALIIIVLGMLLILGVRTSAKLNAGIVLIKLLAISVFLIVSLFHVNPQNWSPFMPFGVTGIFHGAALIFFAYIGFDAVSTAADEARDPQHDLPRGIILSLIICTTLYIAVATLLTGIAPYGSLNTASPVSDALLSVGARSAAGIAAAGAIAGLTSVMLVMFYGQTRIFMAMSQDGLLPAVFSNLASKTRTPVKSIALCGIVMSIVAGLVPISDLAELVNIGTLAAFTLVCGGTIILRYIRPDLHRPFRTPFSPLIPGLGILSCVYLMLNLPGITWLRFLGWMVLGLIIYFTFSRHRSALHIA